VDGRRGLGSHRHRCVTGLSDARFDDDVLHELDDITGRDLQVVDTTALVNSP
jgi:hypothetical protein